MWWLHEFYFLSQVSKAPDGNGGVYSGIFFLKSILNTLIQLLILTSLCLPIAWTTLVGSIGHLNCRSALKSSRLLEDMAARGIKYLDCYGVDNALVNFIFVNFPLEVPCFFLIIGSHNN